MGKRRRRKTGIQDVDVRVGRRGVDLSVVSIICFIITLFLWIANYLNVYDFTTTMLFMPIALGFFMLLLDIVIHR